MTNKCIFFVTKNPSPKRSRILLSNICDTKLWENLPSQIMMLSREFTRFLFVFRFRARLYCNRTVHRLFDPLGALHEVPGSNESFWVKREKGLKRWKNVWQQSNPVFVPEAIEHNTQFYGKRFPKQYRKNEIKRPKRIEKKAKKKDKHRDRETGQFRDDLCDVQPCDPILLLELQKTDKQKEVFTVLESLSLPFLPNG